MRCLQIRLPAPIAVPAQCPQALQYTRLGVYNTVVLNQVPIHSLNVWGVRVGHAQRTMKIHETQGDDSGGCACAARCAA